MTVENTNVKNSYSGNGVTTVFPYTFRLNDTDAQNVVVIITDDTGASEETEDFTINTTAQTVTFPATPGADPLAEGYRITIYRSLPYTQTLNLINQGPFFAEEIEAAFDRQEMQIQQIAEAANRSVKVGVDSSIQPDEYLTEIFRAHDEAQASAAAAAVSETNAGNSETNAGNSATAANNSALAAEAAVQEAKDISKVFGVAGEPYDPNETYNFPDIVVLPDGTAYRCLATSTGEYPSMSSKWVPVALAQGETFERDDNGDLMPREHPQSSSMWQIDEDGNIMPAEVI